MSMAAPRTTVTRRTNAKKAADPLTQDYRIENSPFYQVSRLNSRYMQSMESALKAIGMDIPRWRVLMILHDKSPSSISEISQRGFTLLSTMTRVTQRLAKEGYLELQTNRDDARITDAVITKKGEEAVSVIRQVASQVFNVAFADFSATEIKELNRLLQRVSDNLLLLAR